MAHEILEPELQRPASEKYDRLYPLRRFMGLLRLTNEDVARALGLTTQSVVHFLGKGDTKLSNLCTVASEYGYSIGVVISDRKLPGEMFEYVCCCESIQRKRLFLLRESLRAAGVTEKMISEKLTVNQSNVRVWWEKDDLNVSRIYQIAEAFEKKVFWDIRPIGAMQAGARTELEISFVEKIS